MAYLRASTLQVQGHTLETTAGNAFARGLQGTCGEVKSTGAGNEGARAPELGSRDLLNVSVQLNNDPSGRSSDFPTFIIYLTIQQMLREHLLPPGTEVNHRVPALSGAAFPAVTPGGRGASPPPTLFNTESSRCLPRKGLPPISLHIMSTRKAY